MGLSAQSYHKRAGPVHGLAGICMEKLVFVHPAAFYWNLLSCLKMLLYFSRSQFMDT